VSPRRIRVAGVTADFRVPRGWPTPTDRWVRENAFWQPPTGWAPIDGLRPAPPGWQFWQPNPAWRGVAGRYLEPARMWMRASTWFAAASVVVGLATLLLPVNGIPVAPSGWLTVLVACAFLCAIVALGVRRRLMSRALTALTDMAEQSRTERLVKAYQRYLLDAA
jgi:hypothetical protein